MILRCGSVYMKDNLHVSKWAMLRRSLIEDEVVTGLAYLMQGGLMLILVQSALVWLLMQDGQKCMSAN